MFNRIALFVNGMIVTTTSFASNTLSHLMNVVHDVLTEVHDFVTGYVGHVSAFLGGAHTPASAAVVKALTKSNDPASVPADETAK